MGYLAKYVTVTNPADTGLAYQAAAPEHAAYGGIFWMLRSGALWRDLPESFGPHTTCYNRFVHRRWGESGVEANSSTLELTDPK
ncbi:putative transposase of IS4/5 family DUF4096 [Phyllobacterium bourgognense]|uniref:Putative transposase of IS4/5 family DUF4096 n=1 Tax=Phyllobacterium bourgognense TaxID=314236 RepID=A0A368Z0Y7_9HYPH|nr:putative transposase of IS4/5 family DUF4096 [Phyllobacterium bourgognense]